MIINYEGKEICLDRISFPPTKTRGVFRDRP